MCFDLTASDQGQRRKSKAARRIIPVHRNLLPHILRRIEGADPWETLDTDPRQGPGVFKSFNRQIKLICEDSQPKVGPRVEFTLYGLRHAWIDAMKEAGTEKLYRQYLFGHSHSDLEDSNYGKRRSQFPKELVRKLHETMEKLPYGEESELRLVG